jgi:3-deoxy-7-phosphoheptulonate synthase
MIIVLKREATEETAKEILGRIEEKGLKPLYMPGTERVVLGALGDERVLAELGLDGHPMVESLKPILSPYKLVSREMHPHDTVVRFGKANIGGTGFAVIAGPCAVESREQLLEAAQAVRAAGADLLRGGAFKPRTSPYAFQGLGEAGLRILAEAREATGLPVVTEVLEPDQVALVASYADVLQVGARNMANFALLRRVGQADRPVLLKRGMSATVEEWLMAAEYILDAGNPDVVLCERGIRSFDPLLRFTLDLNAVPLVKELSHLPIIVDPSHGTGKRSLVRAMSLGAIAAGADGLIVEAHQDPDHALCDGAQSITPRELADIVAATGALAASLSPAFAA